MQNIWIQSRAPVVVCPTDKSWQMYLYHSEIENMVDSTEVSHLLNNVEYEPFLAHWKSQRCLSRNCVSSAYLLVSLRNTGCSCIISLGSALPLRHPEGPASASTWPWLSCVPPVGSLRCLVRICLFAYVFSASDMNIPCRSAPHKHCKLIRDFSANRSPKFRLSSSATALCLLQLTQAFL